MASFTALKTAIQNVIKQNGNEEITGDVLQQILLSIVNTMGDGAINTIEQNLSSETLARQGADNTLQSNIDAEALARGNADTQLQNAINAIKANIDNGYVYAGIATPSSTPVSGKVFYVATAAGTYTNFGGQVLTQGINILRYNGSAWSHQQLIGIDDVPTAGSNNFVKSGGVQNELALGAVYDVSAKNPTAGPNSDGKWESLSALLSDANLNTLIPTAYRKGGMSIKFVQSSDNKYVQYRLMSDSFNTTPANWQGVDDEPTAGSEDLVKSGGIFDRLVGTVKFVDGTQDAWNILNGFVKNIYVIGADTSKDVSISYVFKNIDTPYIGKFCIQLAYFLPNSSSELRKNFLIPGTTAGNTLVQMDDESGNSGIEVFIRTQNSPVFDNTSFIQPTDFRILKTAFGENVIPFVLDYIEKNKKESIVVNVDNYSSILPDMNNADEGVVYKLLFYSITTSLPAHLPFTAWGINGLASCIRWGNSTYSTQLLITQAGIYYRILGAEWSDWETLTPIKEVTVGTGGNFSSLLAALKYTSDKTPIRILRNTTIDVEQEYISSYGADFWTNYDGYDNHPDDMMYRGIWLGKGRELYGEENATIVFNYSGNNQNVKEHFSLLAVAGDNYIHDLTIYPSAYNCEYHIHDDWQTGTMESTQIMYERLIFKGSSYSTICIGGGLGNNCSYILKDCLFLCNEASNYNVSYHGCTSGNENAKGRIYVTGCYGLGQLVFRSYGVSTQLTDCIVSNCKFSKIDCFINPGQVNENMRLIAFNNTETGVS